MNQKLDVAVVGGGPGGSATAWRAALAGLTVAIIEKAHMPRDKPCGDGLTPRAVSLLESMGLGAELGRFHRVGRIRVSASNQVHEESWPQRDGLPDYGLVAPRTDLDALLVEHAVAAGARLWDSTNVVGPMVEGDAIAGVRIRCNGHERDLPARVVVAADGASCNLGRKVGLVPRENGLVAVALRAQFSCARPDDDVLEVYSLRWKRGVLPGYGWVFPMGGGNVNLGVGFASTYSGWRSVNIAHLMASFLSRLPSAWVLPGYEQLRRERKVRGWRLPMGLSVWPPWKPGIVAVGDAAGLVKPSTGAGISKALESGLVAADAAFEALNSSVGPRDFSSYGAALQSMWGQYYRQGHRFLQTFSDPHLLRGLLFGAMRVPVLRNKIRNHMMRV